MKGVILAGGLGTRLRPLTRVTNKHLLPVYDKPMVLYPLETLKKSGIEEIMIVCGREHAGHFMNFFGSGKEYMVKLSYALQDTNDGGIADALSYAEDFADGGKIAVILGDNIFEDIFAEEVKKFKDQEGAKVFLKEVSDPSRYGVAEVKNGKIISLEEKPDNPKSNLITTGLYFYNFDIFKEIKNITPSARGELEITDVHKKYVKENTLSYGTVEGTWLDAGTIESLYKASKWMAQERGIENGNE